MIKKVSIKFLKVIFWVVFVLPGTSLASDCMYELVGDLNKDCRVDWMDIALVAQNWLVDCNQTPQDAACVPRVEWHIEAQMLIERDQFTGGVIDGKIYVFGGNDKDGSDLKSTEMFDPNTSTWTSRADNNHNSGYGVEELTGAVLDGKLYVFGAYGWSEWTGTSGVFNFVEEYNPATNNWRSRAPKPTVVTTAPAAAYKDEIYLFGGVYSTYGMSQPIIYRDVEAFKPSTNTWRKVTSIPRNIRLFAVATVGNKAYLIGGYLMDEDRMTGEVMCFDFLTGQWDTDSCKPMPEDRARALSYSAAAPVIDGKIFLVGGDEGSLSLGIWASNKVDVYDPAANTWETRQPLPFSVDSHLFVTVDKRLYVIGGKTGTLKTCFSARY
jgi:N-acetylneuraminic acid mutarotase